MLRSTNFVNTISKGREFTVKLDQKFLKTVHKRRLQVGRKVGGWFCRFWECLFGEVFRQCNGIISTTAWLLTIKLYRMVVHYIKLSNTKFQAICMPNRWEIGFQRRETSRDRHTRNLQNHPPTFKSTCSLRLWTVFRNFWSSVTVNSRPFGSVSTKIRESQYLGV